MTTDPAPDEALSGLQAAALIVSLLGVLVFIWLVFWFTDRTGTHYEILSVRIHGTILTVAAIVVAAYAGILAYGILAQATIGAIIASVVEDSAAWLAAFVVWLILYLISIFSFTYYLLGSPQHWNVALSHVDAVYVAAGTLTTAGTTGISARGDLTRGILIGQMALDLLVVTVLLALVLYRVTQAAKSKSPAEPVSPTQDVTGPNTAT